MDITLPTLAEGEIYAGIALHEDGTPSHHLILLPGSSENQRWQKAMEWAKEVGGELPTRQEQALLYANAKQHFEHDDWYWSGAQLESDEAYAWCQGFLSGSQDYDPLNDELRARAVRRLAL